MIKDKKTDFAVYLLGFLAFWVNGDNYAAAPMLVKIASDLGVGIGTAALSVTSYMLCFGLFTLLFGPLGDRFGRIRILKIAAFGSAAFSMASASVTNLSWLIAVRAVNGAFSAGIMPLAVAYAGESAAPGTGQARIGTVMGLMFLGGALATVIGGGLSYFGSWKTVYFVYGAAELITALFLTVLLENKPAAASRMSVLSSYKAVFSTPYFPRTIGVLFFVGFSTLGAFSFLGKFIQDRTALNLMLVGCVLSAYGIGTLIGGKTAGGIRAVMGNRLFLSAGLGGGAAFLTMGISGAGPLAIAIALSLYGFGFICLQSSLIATAQALVPARRGTVMSATSFAMTVSGSLGTLINGGIITRSGFTAFIVLAGFTFAAAGVLAAVFVRGRIEEAARTAKA
jgi:predicted MFS family arabinose efflux permease